MAQVKGTDPGTGISGAGTTLQGSSSGVVGMIDKVSHDGSEATSIDVTTMNAEDKYKMFIPGMVDAHELTFDLIYDPTNAALIYGLVGVASQTWTVEFPDEATFVCVGFVRKVGLAVPRDDKMTQSMTIKITGKPVFHEPS
jgi:hypothetical protein